MINTVCCGEMLMNEIKLFGANTHEALLICGYCSHYNVGQHSSPLADFIQHSALQSHHQAEVLYTHVTTHDLPTLQ
jgi:hypothetical protein